MISGVSVIEFPPAKIDQYGAALFVEAAKNGDTYILKILEDPRWGVARDQVRFAIVEAARNGHVDVLRYLRESDVWKATSEDARFGDNKPLRGAAGNRQAGVLKELREGYALTTDDARCVEMFEYCCNYGDVSFSPLESVLFNGDAPCLRELREFGLDASDVLKSGLSYRDGISYSTTMSRAMSSDHLDMLVMLKQMGITKDDILRMCRYRIGYLRKTDAPLVEQILSIWDESERTPSLGTKVLVVIVSHSFRDPTWHANIKRFPNSIVEPSEGVNVDMIAVSSEEETLPECGGVWACGPKSLACKEYQLTKFCRAVKLWAERSGGTRYDWYVKCRPELEMHLPLDLKALTPGSINARVRWYRGPLRMKKAASIGARDRWWGHRWSSLIPAETEDEKVILDDMIYAFDAQVLDAGVFEEPPEGGVDCGLGAPPTQYAGEQYEWFHSAVWKSRGAKFAITSIDCTQRKHSGGSGDLVGWPPEP